MPTGNNQRSIKTQALNRFNSCNRRSTWESDLHTRQNPENEKKTHKKIKRHNTDTYMDKYMKATSLPKPRLEMVPSEYARKKESWRCTSLKCVAAAIHYRTGTNPLHPSRQAQQFASNT